MILILYYLKRRKMENYILSIIRRKIQIEPREKYSSYESEIVANVEDLKNFVFFLWVTRLKLSPIATIAHHSRKKGILSPSSRDKFLTNRRVRLRSNTETR
ncbi:hypothetical protein CEXT_557831 [Caerostris extrusa]|uniref:Uncharacterized protein n=1 Tax=Caerostris extrusa TaxID=172846 RepID=A0AAV4MCV0_CAEEX|nr:hypothetical protein CEXT_557831 [Caerostris extrusa]